MINLAVTKSLQGSEGPMDFEISLEIKKGEFLALSGKSGSGKTTFLRILAGLEEADGTIEVNGEVWQNQKKSLAVQKRNIGFVFEDYALFPNMNVEENLLYVQQDKALCTKLLEMTGLDGLRKSLPSTLSGGQKQRVSLCRAMMSKPKILLLDEALSSLDSEIRRKLQGDILAMHKSFETTTIMVSHDPSEMYRLASRAVVLEYGKVVADGLLKTKGSQKFSFEGELLEIKKVDIMDIAVIVIGQQIVEIVISRKERNTLRIGQRITVSSKAFSPIIG